MEKINRKSLLELINNTYQDCMYILLIKNNKNFIAGYILPDNDLIVRETIDLRLYDSVGSVMSLNVNDIQYVNVLKSVTKYLVK